MNLGAPDTDVYNTFSDVGALVLPGSFSFFREVNVENQSIWSSKVWEWLGALWNRSCEKKVYTSSERTPAINCCMHTRNVELWCNIGAGFWMQAVVVAREASFFCTARVPMGQVGPPMAPVIASLSSLWAVFFHPSQQCASCNVGESQKEETRWRVRCLYTPRDFSRILKDILLTKWIESFVS